MAASPAWHPGWAAPMGRGCRAASPRRRYQTDPTFDPEFIMSKSTAAAGLCSWCLNIVRFYKVYCEVEPKRLALEEANAELAEAQDKLSRIKKKIAVSARSPRAGRLQDCVPRTVSPWLRADEKPMVNGRWLSVMRPQPGCSCALSRSTELLAPAELSAGVPLAAGAVCGWELTASFVF